MSDEIQIGPNSCPNCGGEYGEHGENCKYWRAHPKKVSTIDLIEEIETLKNELSRLRVENAELRAVVERLAVAAEKGGA